MKDYKKTFFLFLLIICSLKFFDAVFARDGIFKNLAYGVMFLSIVLAVPHFFKYKGGFVLPVQIICISIVTSVFMAQYTWGQGISYSATTIPCLIWIVFFYLLYLNIPIKAVENIVLIYGIIYMLLFLFQFTHTGIVYFGSKSEFVEDRGIIRVNFPGGGVFFLSCFMAVNKLTNNISYKQKILWLLYALSGIVIIVLQVSRQEIVVMLLVYLIHFLRNVKLFYKIATIIVFAVACYAFLNSNSSISKGLAEQQKEDASAGKDYIRIQAAEYYLTQFTPNFTSKILGNGFFNDNSNYGKALIALNNNYGYFLTDVGLVEVYITFGIFAILGYVLIFIKSITIPLPRNVYYLKYYLWMIMLTCLTSDFLISFSFLVTTVLVLYCYQYVYEKEKLNRQSVYSFNSQ